MATSSGSDPPEGITGISGTNPEEQSLPENEDKNKRMKMLDGIDRAIIEKVCPLISKSLTCINECANFFRDEKQRRSLAKELQESVKKGNHRRIQTLLGMYPDLHREQNGETKSILIDALGNQKVLQQLIDHEISHCRFQNGEY